MRVIKYSFVVCAFMFIYVAFKILALPDQPASLPVQIVITVAALLCIEAGFFVPRSLARGAQRAAQKNPALTPLKQWMTRGVIGLACFEACILYGFLLRFLGGHVWLVDLLFGIGIAAELFWSPGEPPGAAQGNISQG